MSRDRSRSVDTIRAITQDGGIRNQKPSRKVITLWVHDDTFAKEDVLVNQSIFDNHELDFDSLIEIVTLRRVSTVRDFQMTQSEAGKTSDEESSQGLNRHTSRESPETLDTDTRTKCLLSVRPLPVDIKTKHPSLQISISGTIATAFGFRNRSQVVATLVSKKDHTASHVEIRFRDVYLARSDMWKLVESELAGRTVYSGQRIVYLGNVRAVIKNVHVQGRRVNAAYFAETTVPVFRSEAARYVLFIQMSREMWDFDSEGNGEILFNRVINGFLPDLFRRWSALDVKHLVTIVMFGRLEYGTHDYFIPGSFESTFRHARPTGAVPKTSEDFYRVVVTESSAAWMAILDELKKDFRVFLRDVSLEHQLNDIKPNSQKRDQQEAPPIKIRGRLSSAMKGNILEAINIASSQFANDYIDRDLIRTGISVVVITAGSGVFDVDRDLLNLTSENLTNNGIGIDIVCLSRMPLHSAPLFRYPVIQDSHVDMAERFKSSSNTTDKDQPKPGTSVRGNDTYSSFPSSALSSMSPGLSRVASSVFTQDFMKWHYGIPHWIDLSYWTAEDGAAVASIDSRLQQHKNSLMRRKHTKRFVPRVRMYEPQMMGIMELGLANISIPYVRSTSSRTRRVRNTLLDRRRQVHEQTSHSPKSSQENGPAGLLTAHATQQGDMIKRMDEYDTEVFTVLRNAKSRDSPKDSTRVSVPTSPEIEKDTKPSVPNEKSQKDAKASNRASEAEKKAPVASRGLLSLLATPQKAENPRISRSVSYALRGMGAPPRAIASTEINVENVAAQGLLAAVRIKETDKASTAGSIRSSRTIEDADMLSLSDTALTARPDHDSGRSRESPSMPILINLTGQRAVQKRRRESRIAQAANIQVPEFNTSTADTLDLSLSKGKDTTSGRDTDNEGDLDGDTSDESNEGFKPGSIKQDTIPFIRNVNASNPIKYDPNVASWFGKWHHIYPRKPKAATMKWRSLCTPASVPLTTDDFPGLENLKIEFDSSTYLVSLKSDNELREVIRTKENLFSNMLALRLAHGYQCVTHPEAQGLQSMKSQHSPSTLLDQRPLRLGESIVYMTMGSTLQSLSYEGEETVRVIRYLRKKRDEPQIPRVIEYCPNIRTILSTAYQSRTLKFAGYSEEYPWELADSYLANPKKSMHSAVEKLRFWRARFVLLPVEPPATAWRLAQSTSENEEEIHLLGIRALTQMWQRQRYTSPQDKTFAKPAVFRNKNINPLSIIFETLNPSEIVSTELDKLVSADDTGEMHQMQLLAESELFERETATLSQIGQAMQSDKGIEIKNRRWHLRLHYNCFRGEDFTNWLLRTFKEGEFYDRDDCVGFGNTLMEGGLFTHVNGRHNFKDGNYFYSTAPDYRAHRTDSRAEVRQSWMFPASRRSERSVPATPASETASKDFNRSSPAGRRSRSGSITDQAATLSDETLSRQTTEKNRVSISLSKMIFIDVDQRKRSTKAEVAHLYYDRLHNPENCYRFALTWPPTTTSALVENTLSGWASQAEKYGLKLVEVPIAEASKVTDYEPFRAPYKISLAVQPPRKPLSANGNLTSTSFTPLTPPKPDPHFYHKALLKRHNFVLDHEAAKEFPADVDVLLAWGKLEYSMTQYVHRTGVILAQITDDGGFLLLANRLYNARPSTTRDSSNKFTTDTSQCDRNVSRNRATTLGQPPISASGILGLNVAAPFSPFPSPMVKASAEVFGNRGLQTASGFSAFVTPEQIKDDLEAFASSTSKLETFYKEVEAVLAAPPAKMTSSSVMRPDKGPDMGIIPEIRLPPSIVTKAQAEAASASGGMRVVSGDKGLGSPLVKADPADEISEAVKSPMRGATL